MDGMDRAFRHYGGVPRTVLMDNPTALVAVPRSGSRPPVFNERLQAFARYWGFEPRACHPYRAQTMSMSSKNVTLLATSGGRLAHLLFQVVAELYESGSVLLTSNQAIGDRGQVLGDEVVATAILDRLLHHSQVIAIRGESYRLRDKRRAGLVAPRATAEAQGKTW